MVVLKLVDWISVNCRFIDKNAGLSYQKYIIDKINIFTPVFEVVEYVYKKTLSGELLMIATITRTPRSTALPKDLIIVKFENAFLYQKNLNIVIKEFLNDIGLNFIAFSRIDFTADFNEFIEYKNPQNLIDLFINNKIIKSGKGKFRLVGTYSKKIKGETLTFGCGNSPLMYYLYNKSLEQKQKKYKPHIELAWIEAGLNINNVWRLEFRLQGNKKFTSINNQINFTLDKTNIDIISNENISNVFNALFVRYFEFFINNNKKRIDRNEKLKLLPLESKFIVSDSVSELKESTISERIFIKKMYLNYMALKGTDDSLAEMQKDNANYYIIKHHLEEWANKKEFKFI